MNRDQLSNDAERRLWDASTSGELMDLGLGDPADDDFELDAWGEDRVVRAEVIGQLLLGVRDADRGHIAKVRLAGARISGALNLGGGETPHELYLNRCWLDQEPDLADACTKSMGLISCRLPGFMARGWQVAGRAYFDASRVIGLVDLTGAKIGGVLSLVGATLSNPGGDALSAANLTVDQGMFCQDGFSATGMVDLTGAKIGGVLSLVGATLSNPGGDALSAQNLTVDQGMFCRGGFSATGVVDLGGAKIGGQLSLVGAMLTNPGGDALSAQNLTVERDMFCQDGFSATGVVDLSGAKIGGQLSMIGATLSNPGGNALNAQNLTVERDMFCQDGFSATGVVDLSGAKIGGQLSMIGATLTNLSGNALNAQSLTVEEDMYCHDGFTAVGELYLVGASIGQRLTFRAAKLANASGNALSAENLTVEQTLYCVDGFTAEGTIDLNNAKLGGATFDGATLKVPESADQYEYTTLNCESLTTDQLTLRGVLPGVTDLRRAAIGVLAITGLALNATARLSGLTYTDLDPQPTVKQRLTWLGRDPDGYHPQPYEQLAAYYRANGHDREARLTLLQKRRSRRAQASRIPYFTTPLRRVVTVLRCLPGWAMDGLAGYGYVPARAFAWLLVAIAVGTWLLYSHAPTSPTGSHAANALLLAIDSIIPTAPFGLLAKANLTGTAFIIAMTLQGLGYALSIAVLPAVTRALSQADK